MGGTVTPGGVEAQACTHTRGPGGLGSLACAGGPPPRVLWLDLPKGHAQRAHPGSGTSGQGRPGGFRGLLAHQAHGHHLGHGRTSLWKSPASQERPVRSGLGPLPGESGGGSCSWPLWLPAAWGLRGRGGCWTGPLAGLSRQPRVGLPAVPAAHFWVFHAVLRTQLCPPIQCPSTPHRLQPGSVAPRPRDARNQRPHTVNPAAWEPRPQTPVLRAWPGNGHAQLGSAQRHPPPPDRKT